MQCEPIPSRARQCCSECIQLGRPHGIVRSVARFAVRYYAARLLSARLFQGADAVASVEKEILSSQLFAQDHKRMQEIMTLSSGKLQQFVRASWLSEAKGGQTEAFKNFNAVAVYPSLQCNISNIPDRMSDVVARFDAILSSQEGSDQDLANLKLASAALKGSLSMHPLVHGLALQCARLCEKQERGIFTMRGRRSKETSLETDLISDAGLQLSIACGNKQLMQMFGLAVRAHKTALDDLELNSLPSPALALLWPDILKKNWMLVDQRIPKMQGLDHCILFDFALSFCSEFLCILHFIAGGLC